MRVPRLAGARVLLAGDVARGGVFAALVGTLALLDPADRARVGGLIVNKLRGEGSILAPGLDELVARTGVPVLGVRSEEHTSELQSRSDLVCRLLLEKKKTNYVSALYLLSIT